MVELFVKVLNEMLCSWQNIRYYYKNNYAAILMRLPVSAYNLFQLLALLA